MIPQRSPAQSKAQSKASGIKGTPEVPKNKRYPRGPKKEKNMDKFAICACQTLNLKTKCYNARKEEEKKKNYGNKSKENL